MKTFHNTISLGGAALEEAEAKAGTQQEIILAYFIARPKQYFTPFDIWENVFGKSIPVTSVRRAMTNLTDNGDLRKTDKLIPEQYGMRNHQWTLADRHIFTGGDGAQGVLPW